MSTDQADLKLRFRAGKFEEQLLYLILVLQLTLGTMLVIMTAGLGFFTLSATSGSARSDTFLLWVIPVLIGMTAVLYLLTYLYE